MDASSRRSFTLIELLIVVAVIAVLATVVIIVLNPAELLRQSRDSNRISDMRTMSSALNLYGTDQSGASSFSLGSSSVLYISVPDASSTCGDLGMPALPSGWTYHCASSSTYRNANGTGWLPVTFSAISSGNPLGTLPVDPVNQTSTYEYYSYATNGSQWQMYGLLESQKYENQEASTGGYDPASYKVGTNVNIAPFAAGMAAYWPMDEGSGGMTADKSGYGNAGTLYGGTTWTTGPKGGGALAFDGSTGYVQLAGNLSSTIMSPNGLTICAWVDANTGTNPGGNVYQVFGDIQFQFTLWSWSGSPNWFGTSLNDNFANSASGPQAFYSGSWHEVCGIRSAAGAATIYVDGAQDGAGGQFAGLVTSPSYSNAIFGSQTGSGSTSWFSGSITGIRIYQRMLSPQEIAGMFTYGN